MTKTLPSLLQRVARGVLVGLCGAMAVGLIGAVTVRGMDRSAGQGPATVRQEMTLAARSAAEHLPVDPTPAALAPIAFETAPVTVSTPVLVKSPARAKSRVIRMEVTGYCPCKKCCGPDAHGVTASGKKVSHDSGRFVAADTRVLPFGTKLSIPGYHDGRNVEVIDRGGAIKGNKLDLYFPTHDAAKQWGRKAVAVTVVEP